MTNYKILDYKAFSNKSLLQQKNLYTIPKATLLIGFYNNTKLLDNVLASLKTQTMTDFELIICDDGSKPAATEHIHMWMRSTDILTTHIWHEDNEFRKVESLNKALHHTESNYIITIDQDCVLHPNFIQEHFENREPNVVLSGRRTEFSPFVTNLITPSRVQKKFIQNNFFWIIFCIFFRKDNKWDKGLYLKNRFLRKILNKKERPLLGCNLSLHKDDLIKINGYDMRLTFPCGSEDADIEYRLKFNGVSIKSICHIAVQYHLYHNKTTSVDRSIAILVDAREKKQFYTPHGFNQIIPSKIINLN